jgi:hypothetical protein
MQAAEGKHRLQSGGGRQRQASSAQEGSGWAAAEAGIVQVAQVQRELRAADSDGGGEREDWEREQGFEFYMNLK